MVRISQFMGNFRQGIVGVFQHAFCMLHTLQDLENWLKEFRTQPVADWEVKRRELMARDGIIEHFFVEV